jgi:hypothetical protein
MFVLLKGVFYESDGEQTLFFELPPAVSGDAELQHFVSAD